MRRGVNKKISNRIFSLLLTVTLISAPPYVRSHETHWRTSIAINFTKRPLVPDVS